MADSVEIKRKIFGKSTFANTVDTNFNQLVPSEDAPQQTRDISVQTFFDDYSTLFYDIPPSGSTNSHLDIINRSSEYIGLSIEDLQQEIVNLREENVALKKQLFSISNPEVK